jgi:hypothetical protein
MGVIDRFFSGSEYIDGWQAHLESVQSSLDVAIHAAQRDYRSH